MQSDRVVCLNMQELFQLENHILVSASLICYNVEAKKEIVSKRCTPFPLPDWVRQRIRLYHIAFLSTITG